MPTYDYLCRACGHAFDLFQSMSERTRRKCPECGEPKLERLIGTGAGIVFKGSGFYETDYRSKSYSEDAKKDATAAKSGEKKPTGEKSKDGAADTPGKDSKKAKDAE